MHAVPWPHTSGERNLPLMHTNCMREGHCIMPTFRCRTSRTGVAPWATELPADGTRVSMGEAVGPCRQTRLEGGGTHPAGVVRTSADTHCWPPCWPGKCDPGTQNPGPARAGEGGGAVHTSFCPESSCTWTGGWWMAGGVARRCRASPCLPRGTRTRLQILKQQLLLLQAEAVPVVEHMALPSLASRLANTRQRPRVDHHAPAPPRHCCQGTGTSELLSCAAQMPGRRN